jgi:hypothetical protein
MEIIGIRDGRYSRTREELEREEPEEEGHDIVSFDLTSGLFYFAGLLPFDHMPLPNSLVPNCQHMGTYP